MQTCTYLIRHKETGRTYYGLTNDPERRWDSHCKAGREDSRLHRAIAKHGPDAFEFEVLEWHNVRKDAQVRERALIRSALDAGRPLYNLTEGGEAGYNNFGWSKKPPSARSEDPERDMLDLVSSATAFDQEREDDFLCENWDPHSQYPW